ncbi:MAG: hypothetical protein H0T42_06885 [Deltaproteobacteria bacterium]|nr:hypothetical protein [Deltaproteobacteria bacterium]
MAWMINEQDQVESSYAGLYPASFTDGYATALPITRYLRADFASPRPPSHAVNEIAP